ncbi:MAG: sensor domain-containing diguanylate cyclase [Candidatus Goldbacteria bacterium]|nr:sensor domain-containing diguanylate cyclase [Candidatus Goldiibacteriota bacterium]
MFFLFLTLTGISGGSVSVLKWSIYILVFFALMQDLYLHGAIMLSIFFLSSLKDFKDMQRYDLFSFLCIAALLAILYLTKSKTNLPKKNVNFVVDTDKEIKDFKSIISDLLEKTLNVYRGFLKAESVLFFYRKPETEEFSIMFFSSSSPDDILQTYQFSLKEDIIGVAVNKREFFIIHASQIKIPYYKSSKEIKDVITFPLLSGKIIGAIVCDFAFNVENGETAKFLMQNLSSEIINILYLFDINNKVMEREQRISILYDIYGKLNFMESRHNIMAKFFEEIKKFDICSGYLAEYNAGDSSFSVVETYNYPGTITGTRLFPKESELLKYVFKNDKHILIDNVSDKNIPLNFKKKNVDKFFISLLKSRTEPLGFIKLDKEANYYFSDFEIQTIQMLLSKVAVLLENVKLYEKVKRQATEDGLTSLYNHITFQEKLLQTFAKTENGLIKNVSLALIDIDFFKKFNDSFGHQEGDRVLVKLADVLKKFTEENTNTWTARYGGEEFFVVMEDYDINSACKLMEEMREFSEKNLKGGNDREQRPITLSIGVATYPYYVRNTRELIKAADDALYLAKQEGRNRVKSIVDVNKRKI